jgi:hypothetical protein
MLGGTGQVINRLKNDEIDVAMYADAVLIDFKLCTQIISPSALTDPLISGIANGETCYKLIGSYVNTPLNWSVTCDKILVACLTRRIQGSYYWEGFQV